MKVVQQTIASLGSPMWIEPLERPGGSAAVIARWQYLNGRLLISTADAIRVCLSLSTGQQVRHAERDRARSKHILAGDVMVLRPGIPAETTIEGDAEVVQIFIQPESLGQPASDTVRGTLVAPAGDALKRVVCRGGQCRLIDGSLTHRASAHDKAPFLSPRSAQRSRFSGRQRVGPLPDESYAEGVGDSRARAWKIGHPISVRHSAAASV
jgi:hypothetical protein